MSQIKVCPHCGSKMFVGAITRGCAVESVIDENGNPSFKVVKEGSGDKYDLEILKCCRCKNDVKVDELVEGVPCKECGRIVNPDELDENGLCEVCAAVKKRSELANASREELIQMLLNAEKQANPITAKVEKQVKKAEKAEEKKSADDEVKEEKPTAKRGGRRGKVKVDEDTKSNDNGKDKADDNTSENTDQKSEEEPQVTETEVAEAVNDIANQQDAPFPDIPDTQEAFEQSNQQEELPLPMNPPESTETQTEGFKMFDDRDEEPF